MLLFYTYLWYVCHIYSPLKFYKMVQNCFIKILRKVFFLTKEKIGTELLFGKGFRDKFQKNGNCFETNWFTDFSNGSKMVLKNKVSISFLNADKIKKTKIKFPVKFICFQQ